MWYVYQTYKEAQTAADTVNANYIELAPVNQGSARHGVHPVSVYCQPIECVEGWAVIADEVTSQFINDTPQEITYPDQTAI